MEVTNAAKQRYPKLPRRSPELGGTGLYEGADCQPNRGGHKCGNRSRARGRARCSGPAPFEARIFVRVVVSYVVPFGQVIAANCRLRHSAPAL